MHLFRPGRSPHLLNQVAALFSSPPVRLGLRAAASFFFSLLLLCLLYRSVLCHGLYTEPAIPPSYTKEVPVAYFWKYVRNDLAMSVAALALFSVVSGGFLLGARSRLRPLAFASSTGLFTLAALLLTSAALILRLHYRLLFEVSSGLTVSLLVQSLHQLGAGNVWKLIGFDDLAFLLFPAAVFALFFTLSRRPVRTVAICFFALSCVVFGLQGQPKRKDVNWEIMQNPVQFFVLDLTQTIKSGSLHQTPNPLVDPRNIPSPTQMDSVQLVDPVFTHAGPQPPPLAFPSSPRGQWNVLVLILESTGAEYIFDPSCDDGAVPMPFLQRMSREGLTLANHYSSGNTSPKAAFGLFTGLYCPPDPIDFAVHGRNCIPTFHRFLDEKYATFLLTPLPSSFYFPLGLLKNNGIQVFDSSSIPASQRLSPDSITRNELDGVDFLLKKIDAIAEPFCIVYWSGLAHWPYPDYGEETHIAHTGNPKRDSYYNNLRVLDTQLERIFHHLETTGKLQNTLLLFVGDHGEAFGRHPGVAMHGFGSFNETYKTPAIFYQPTLFRPQHVDWPTSHADIAPTLLDALNVRFPESQFQGESVLRGKPRRKYLFTLSGDGNYLSAISPEGRKISLLLAYPESYAYDLAQDPLETVRLDSTPEEIDTLAKFANYQRRLIPRYNQSIWEKRFGTASQADGTAREKRIGEPAK